MKTTELIEFLKHNDVTEDQLYNLLIADLDLATKNTAGSIADPMPQRLIFFFMYEIQAVVFPVIRDLRDSPRVTRIAALEANPYELAHSALRQIKQQLRTGIDAENGGAEQALRMSKSALEALEKHCIDGWNVASRALDQRDDETPNTASGPNYPGKPQPPATGAGE